MPLIEAALGVALVAWVLNDVFTAVDPAQSDALLARLTLVKVDTDRVVASITGKVSQISTTHVVLIVRPRTSWWRDHQFLFGAVGGAVLGGLTGFALR